MYNFVFNTETVLETLVETITETTKTNHYFKAGLLQVSPKF